MQAGDAGYRLILVMHLEDAIQDVKSVCQQKPCAVLTDVIAGLQAAMAGIKQDDAFPTHIAIAEARRQLSTMAEDAVTLEPRDPSQSYAA
jgi:hypothetical protein